MITRKEYMQDSTNLFHAYYLQFATEVTKQQVLSSIGLDKLLASKDGAFSDIKLPFNHMGHGGGWWWDTVTIKTSLLKQLGESNSLCTHTCVGKAVARELLKEHATQ